MHLFEPGDHIIAGHDIYGGTYRLFADVFTRMGSDVSFVNMGNPKNVQSAIIPETKGIWIETPSNPLLNIVEIAAITKIAKEAGGDQHCGQHVPCRLICSGRSSMAWTL